MTTAIKTRIQSLLQDARLEEAKKLCQTLCRENSKDAEAWFLLGSIYGQSSEYDKAIESFLKSISIQNNKAITHHNLGLVYLRSGNPGMARNSLAAALEIDPGSIATRLELANAMQAEGTTDEAIPIYLSILQYTPDALPVLSNLAIAYASTKNFDKAIPVYRKILALHGNSAEVLFMLGNAYRLSGLLKDAENTYRKALNINPRLSGVLNNLGIVLSEQELYKDAEDCFIRSLEVEPHQTDAYINLANCLQDQRKTPAALDILDKALDLHPDKTELHWDISLVLLKLGRFEQGWREYEWRLKGNNPALHRIPLPLWAGEDLDGKSVLVAAEQGIGDEIMFASCFRYLEKHAAHVVIDCEERLAPIFRRSFPSCDIRPGKQSAEVLNPGSLAGIDVQIFAGSIPLYLYTRHQEFHGHGGYLSADPDDFDRWRKRYLALGRNINIGLSWKGGHVSKMKKRSTSINDWLPVLRIPGVNFINLQYGDFQDDIDTARNISGTTIHHWKESDPLSNMDDFAAQISALDLVISVDNSTAHLAGALAVKTWLLQPFNTDWRWLENTIDSYWYPEVEQFHPHSPGEWGTMMDTVAARLREYANSGIPG